MDKDEIKLDDLYRILVGEAPAIFLLEVLIRSVITYCILLIVLKFMGKRMSGKLTNTETAVMLMFGAVVSSGMQIPDRGVLESAVVLGLILLLQRGYTLLNFRSRKVEKITLGTTSLMVKDGVVQQGFMKKELVSLDELKRNLRSKKILQLGEVKRMYMETNGMFTIVPYKEPVPGLAVLPDDAELREKIYQPAEGRLVCANCGQVYERSSWPGKCAACDSTEAVPAVLKSTRK